MSDTVLPTARHGAKGDSVQTELGINGSEKGSVKSIAGMPSHDLDRWSSV